MYVINNHEAIVGIYYGHPATELDQAVDTSVGIEIKPPLNNSEQQLIELWLANNAPHYILYFGHMSHTQEASRYGISSDVSRSAEMLTRIRNLGNHIRKAIESAGREVAVVEEVYNLDR